VNNEENKKIKKKRTLLQRIVNIFLYTCIFIFILLIIAFGFSQTSTFRNYLKDFVVEQADSAMNGNLHIGKIEGTIFTSLILRNTVLNMGNDTLLNAGTISLKASPLHLLFKSIYVRSFEIRNAKVSFIKDSNGELNFSRLFPPSKQKDTTKSSFPFTIQLAKLQLLNVNFSMQNYDTDSKRRIYDGLNINDLRVNKINLSLSAFADLNKHDFNIEINKLNASPNISHFFLDNLKGNFLVNEKGMEVNDLNVVTNKSRFQINSKVDKFNPFDSTSSFNTADINLDLHADSVNFSDLTAFIPPLNILKGKVAVKVKTSGSLHKLNIDLLEVQYDSTRLNAKGNIRSLDDPDDMYITTAFYNSYVNQSDVNKLLPSIHVPTYPELGLLKFDTLIYKGRPVDFNSNFYLKTKKGDLAVNANLNVASALLQYDVRFRTVNFDISPFAGINTNLNSRGRIKGEGTSPQNLNANFYYNANGSIVKGNKIDTLRLRVSAKSQNINYRLRASSDTMKALLSGNFDFTNLTPSYKIMGDIEDFNIAKLSADTTFNTSLNFSINAEGENFELDKMNLFLNMKLYNSFINNIHIDSTRAIVDLRSNDNGQRIVNIISDLADITLDGNFSINQVVSLFSAEADLISTSIKNKMEEIFPSSQNGNIEPNYLANKNLFAAIDSSTNVQYLVDLKNFELISLLLGNNQLEVDGELSGEIKNNKDSVEVSLKSRLDYVKFWGKQKVFFLSNLNLNFNLKNSFNANSFSDLYTDLHVKTDRIFTGSDIKDLAVDFDLTNNKAKLYLSTNLENYASAKLSGNLDLSGKSLNLLLDTLNLRYNQFSLINKKIINLTYMNDSIGVKDFILDRQDGIGEIEINGTLLQTGSQDLKILLKNFRGKDLSKNLLELEAGNTLLGSINLNAGVTGNFENPLVDAKVDIDSVTYKNKNLGALKGNFNYKEKNLSVDLRFIDSLENYNNPQLLITGSVPVDLGLTSEESSSKSGLNSAPINLKLIADNFNLASFGNVLPYVRELKGILTGKLNVSGKYNNIDPEGTLSLKNMAFIADANNLEYNAGLKVNVTKGSLSIDSLLIENSKGTQNGGRMTGSGKAVLDNLDIKSSQFALNGKLKVLSETSKSVSPSVYGDLVIATNGNIEFTMDNNGALLQAPITITDANLTFPPTQSAYQNNLQGYIYKYVQDTPEKAGQDIDFESLVKLSQERGKNNANNSLTGFKFDYKIDVEVEKEAKIIFIISKELNQKLTAVLSGNFQYEKTGGTPNAQGELKLLEGSNLQFFRTLTADGSIRFESELDNPYLDITATYSDYYYPPDSSSQEQKVAVKIKIQGPLKELDRNFIQEKNNVAVYVGQTAIDNDEPSPQYDASDAVLFIIAGRFVNQSSSTNTNGTPLAASASTSLAGSILGGFLNSYLGDYVRSIQLRKVGSQTKVNLVGRVKDFRYSIGGSTDVFQDLSQANVMIEYPIFKSLLVRLERKEALRQTGIQTEMINELGLKYKFEF